MLPFGSIMVLVFLICSIIITISGYISLRSISATDVSPSTFQNIKQGRNVCISVIILSTLATALQIYFIVRVLQFPLEVDHIGFSGKMRRDNDKCESPQCSETIRIV